MFHIKTILLVLLVEAILSSQSEPPSPLTNCGATFIKQNKSFNVFTSTTYSGEFPWHVAVYRREKYGSRTFICSAVLLNQNTCVTTAHCLYGDYGAIAAASLIISLGKYDIDVSALSTEEMHAAATVIYEKFDRFNLEHDIALIKMASNATYTNYVHPICLVNRMQSAKNLFVIGWGHNKLLSGNGNVLAKGEIGLQAADECHHNHMDLFANLLDSATKMCGKYVNGTDLCPSDAGSGLFHEHNGRWFLTGIFSFGVTLSHRKRCDSAQLILFTNVLNYYDWIVENM